MPTPSAILSLELNPPPVVSGWEASVLRVVDVVEDADPASPRIVGPAVYGKDVVVLEGPEVVDVEEDVDPVDSRVVGPAV
jgi:hypothetical protein